mmetsp:Transcript_33223/g.94131  ORF Transcript_33223/g.94131 Transcript_33223/m.94131 type:complete len:255 (+) Transcript_33223:1009-1773(+)
MSHTRMVLSADAEKRRRSWASTAQTISSCPCRMLRCGPSSSHRKALVVARLVGFCVEITTLCSAAQSCIALRRAKLGVSSRWRRRTPVAGQVRLPWASQRSMQARSYVWPVATITGSDISSMLMGQKKLLGASRARAEGSSVPTLLSCLEGTGVVPDCGSTVAAGAVLLAVLSVSAGSDVASSADSIVMQRALGCRRKLEALVGESGEAESDGQLFDLARSERRLFMFCWRPLSTACRAGRESADCRRAVPLLP